MKFLRKLMVFPFHVLLITLYSPLAFLAANITQVDLSAANRLLLILIAGSLIVLTVTRFLVRRMDRAGLIIFMFLIIFFSYGHVKELLRVSAHSLSRNVLLVPIALGLFLGGLFLVRRLSKRNTRRSTIYLNIVSLLLLVFPSVSIINHEILMASYLRSYRARVGNSLPASTSFTGNLPDIYFIVLDGYARSDILKQEIGLDNSDFLNGLRTEGFYIADCSMSNYAQTGQSLASTFNMMYLDNLLAQAPSGKLTEDYFAPYIKHSQVRQFFESLGYKTVSFFTGYYWAQWEDATYFMGDPRLRLIGQQGIPSKSGFQITSFEKKYMETTLLLSAIEVYQQLVPASEPLYSLLSGIDGERSIVLTPLDDFPQISNIVGPKFVFLHLLLPHFPYVFGPNGEVTQVDMADRGARLQGYRDQVLYTDKRILPLMDELITRSKGNVVIFLEGDHGLLDYQQPASRMANLSAIYFPDRDYSSLYPQMSPVNSFRILLTQYFKQDYPLLDDKSYFSHTDADQTFESIPNSCTGK